MGARIAAINLFEVILKKHKIPCMGARKNFSRGGKVDIVLIFVWLLAMQRKLT